MIKGNINDSIPQRFLFDTGAQQLVVLNKLKEKIKSPISSLQLGDVRFPSDLKVYFLSDNHPFSYIYDADDVAVLAWSFLDGKTFGLFFTDKNLKIWDDIKDVENLSEYDSIQIERKDQSFYVPVSIIIQDKKIEEKLLFDTGSNGYIDFDKTMVSKYNLDLECIPVGKGFGAGTGKYNDKRALIADTIKIGKQIITEEKQYIGFFNEAIFNSKSIGCGLLGLSVLRHFDFIIDSKNNYLYLKRIQE
jgi:predicted aspartyl protease